MKLVKKYGIFEISNCGMLKLGIEENDYGNIYRVLDYHYDTEQEAEEALFSKKNQIKCEMIILPIYVKDYDEY